MRNMGVIETAMMKKKLSAAQRRDTNDLAPPRLDEYSYVVDNATHDAIMEQRRDEQNDL